MCWWWSSGLCAVEMEIILSSLHETSFVAAAEHASETWRKGNRLRPRRHAAGMFILVTKRIAETLINGY
jgi:hypothetical protein